MDDLIPICFPEEIVSIGDIGCLINYGRFRSEKSTRGIHISSGFLDYSMIYNFDDLQLGKYIILAARAADPPT